MEWLLIIQVLSAVLLVIVTGFYTWTAYKTWKEMKNSNRGLVVARIDPFGVGASVIKIINIGASAATNIKVEFKTLPEEDISGKWEHYLLEKEEYALILLRDKNNKEIPILELTEKYDFVEVNIVYSDIYRKIHRNIRRIDLNKFSKTTKENVWLIENSLKDEVHDVANQLKKINQKMGPVVRELKKSNKKEEEQ
ncbi:MAG: hypothetical protein ACOCRX_12345 [Candidatus Woesearchaeota archaeon]